MLNVDKISKAPDPPQLDLRLIRGQAAKLYLGKEIRTFALCQRRTKPALVASSLILLVLAIGRESLCSHPLNSIKTAFVSA